VEKRTGNAGVVRGGYLSFLVLGHGKGPRSKGGGGENIKQNLIEPGLDSRVEIKDGDMQLSLLHMVRAKKKKTFLGIIRAGRRTGGCGGLAVGAIGCFRGLILNRGRTGKDKRWGEDLGPRSSCF